ncbi:MAG: 2-oxoisovalerate dehydrogenase, partial [Bacteriovoracaceae bacterium]|nr:2-oxoisovalerate dehydrogenase [Bacteriovoracaceae bacterium]
MKIAKIYSLEKKDAEQKNIFGKWYRLLSLGRMLDERAPNYLKQALGWSYHAPYAGHDGIQLAIGQIFNRETDHLFPYYRDMLTCLSAGISAEEIILNGLSKASDVASGGRHMSNHFAKPEWNIHNVSSCTGNHTLHAVGVARAMKYYAKKGVAISSQGESSVSEGYCYEAINGASREKLPVLFVFQDNGYGISVPKSEQTANEKVAANFSGFKNLRIIYCDGKDILDSMNAMEEAKKHILEKEEPVIVHADCVRIGSHSNSDKHELYRDEAELAQAKAQDPFMKFKYQLLQNNIFSAEELESFDQEAKDKMIQAHTQGVKAPHPTADSIWNFVVPPSYQSQKYSEGLPLDSSATDMSFIEAINETLKSEFRYNPDTFLWGQDVANKEKGGIFNVTKGMQKEFGPKRIFNGPIAEDFILGTANGFSRFNSKIRVVVEGAEFADYFWPAMEQLVESSHEYWRTNGQFSPNVTVRLASGGYIGGGLYHSQNIEGTLCTFPGIRVVVPAFADDAAGLLRTCLRSEGMTLFLEPKALYNAKYANHAVPADFEVPFGKARIRRVGSDLSLITYGHTVHFCLEAAVDLEKKGYSVEVLDLRSLNPLDEEAILKTVQKTSRAVVVHEDKVFAGFGGEIVSFITEYAFKSLDAPVKRVGSTFTPVG